MTGYCRTGHCRTGQEWLDIDGPDNDGPIVTKLQRWCRCCQRINS